MSDFTSQPPASQLVPPDPTKHVNYTLGMVLGVDDFVQEFAYLSGRNQWLARDLIGYGTVWGLQITKETLAGGTRVAVSPGVAISPSGQLIRVTPAQCATLDNWLKSHQANVLAHSRVLDSPGGEGVQLYAVLSYRACPTDDVPIPGEPCRTEDDSRAASRWKDDFQLELRFEPPRQGEEEAIRSFSAWLAQSLEISDQPGQFVTLDQLLQAIRDSAPPAASSPCAATDFVFSSPAGRLRIHPADATEYLRAVLRLWVTELRPRWHYDLFAGRPSCGCVVSSPETGSCSEQDCVLLAELFVPIKADGTLRDPDQIVINEERRPCLGHLRLMQEWSLRLSLPVI